MSILIRNNPLINYYRNLRYFYYKYFYFSDEKLVKKQFRGKLRRKVNLENPVKYNDKLQWLKLNWYDPLATICADKYEVRHFVEERIGKQYLNELYAVYDSIDDVKIKELPESFVLKATHGTGDNIICDNKMEVDWDSVFKMMKKWLKRNIYWSTREWVYKDIKPRIICEKNLSDENNKPPYDYKIFCFNGEPKLIQIDIDRFSDHKQAFYDTSWNLLNIQIGSVNNYKGIKIKKPNTLEKMLELSSVLSNDFPHVRVDFYNLKDRIVFGELTFFHQNGLAKFNPPDFERKMGSWLKLPLLDLN